MTGVLAGLRSDDPRLIAILGGRETMLELPFMQEILAERRQKHIIVCLRARLGGVPSEVEEELRPIEDDAKLDALLEWAAQCPDVDAFRSRLKPHS